MTDGGSLGVAPRTSVLATDVLLVEDDDGDALLVEELMLDAGEPFRLRRVSTIAEATRAAEGARCALVDLGLPDAQGLDAVARLRAAAPDLAVVVLTGLADRGRGIEAVAAGAQDYLVKGEVDGPTLARAVRYAVERRRAEADARGLLLAQQRQAENDRLARGLLPHLRLGANGVDVVTRSIPGGRDALVGGDFYDALDRPDGTVRAVIGDVCGHGPDEAAIGVALRIAWRALVLSGASPDDVLAGVDAILCQERDRDTTFATVCDVTIDAATATATVRLHGHPPPLVLGHGQAAWSAGAVPAMPLGVFEHQVATPHAVPLADDWQLVLVTDGLYEARVGDDRLGMDRLADLFAGLVARERDPQVLVDRLLEEITVGEQAELDDDVAVLILGRAR
jgi:serine phosphatase RsbU (regulator of sigma subunit)